MPLIVHSIWRAPAMAPERELAVARPRSFWQCVLMMTLSAPGVLRLMSAMRPPNSWGRFHPVVSGMLSVVAPACFVVFVLVVVREERVSVQGALFLSASAAQKESGH